ncbi:hypothetical protein ACFLTZ_04365 [Chloroflexota bacterium]
MNKVFMVALIVLVIAIPVIAIDFWLEWLPLGHSVQYPGKVSALFAAISSVVTLIIAFIAFRAIEAGREKEKRDRKDRVLDEVNNWCLEIINIPLSMNAKVSREFEFNIHILNMLNKYGSAITRGIYIRAIIKVYFDKKLLDRIDSCRDILATYAFIKGKSIGVDISKSLKGKYDTIKSNVEALMNERNMSIENLEKEFGKKLSEYFFELVYEIATVKASLLK